MLTRFAVRINPIATVFVVVNVVYNLMCVWYLRST
jgi:hypothetical protein